MRDWITKALVQLLHGHLDVMRALVERFWSVNDPYVVQRVIAIAYGCLLRSSPAQAGQTAALAEAVHTRVFTPPVRADELLLDAARGITRWAVEHALLPEDARAAATRPYGIATPSAPPAQGTIDAKYGRWREVPENENYLSIFTSVLSMGDFGRYVVESGIRHFSRHPFGKLIPDRAIARTPRFVKSRWAAFVASLRPEQKEDLAAWLRDPDPRSMGRLRFLRPGAEDPFTGAQRDLLDAVWTYPKVPNDDYPVDRARRWVFRRTLSLGWTPARFAAKDRTLGHGRSREGHKAERWGKKYQWMAYHELLARVADNYQSARRYDDEQQYEGLHQIVGQREIDPSLPPVDFRAFHNDEGAGVTAWQPPLLRLTEWPPANLDFRRYRGDIQQLLADAATEPAVATSVFVRDRDGHDWVVLNSYIKKIDPAAHKSWRGLQETSTVDALLVTAEEAPKFVAALADRSRSTIHDLLDTHGHIDCCYVGEIGRIGPACYHRHSGFETVEVAGQPFSIGRTVETYAWEGSIFDCSIDETASTVLPSTLLQQSAGLSFDMRGPSWLDADGFPVFAYYRQLGNDGCALLVRATYLQEYLAKRQLELVVLHWFERMELTGAYDGPYPAISASIAARMGADLALHEGRARRDERDLAKMRQAPYAAGGIQDANVGSGQDNLP